MDQPVFKTSFLGNQTEIYQDRLVYRGLFGILAKISLPLKEVASVSLGPIWMPGAMIETSGGQKYGFYLPFSQKEDFLKTITDLKNRTA